MGHCAVTMELIHLLRTIEHVRLQLDEIPKSYSITDGSQSMFYSQPNMFYGPWGIEHVRLCTEHARRTIEHGSWMTEQVLWSIKHALRLRAYVLHSTDRVLWSVDHVVWYIVIEPNVWSISHVPSCAMHNRTCSISLEQCYVLYVRAHMSVCA